MRPKVLIVCLVVPALCVMLVMRHRATPAPMTAPAETATTVPANASGAVAEVAIPPVATQVEVPKWETRFLEIASEPEYLQSQEELEELAASLTDDEVGDALKQLQQEQSTAALVFGRALARRWAEKSPESAAQWALTLSDNVFSHTVLKEMMIPWAANDLTATINWVQQLPEGGNKAAAELSLAGEAARQSAGATSAVAMLSNLPPSPERDDLLNYSLRQWATDDPENALAWMNQMPDQTARERALDTVAMDMTDPFTAATFAAENLSPGPGRDQAVVNIVQFWTTSAPDEAAAWVTQFPNGPLRDAATRTLLEVWEKENPAAANMWAQAIVPP